MKISIAICTWNRSRLLRQTLDSLVAMEIPPDIDWEVVLVDNRSTDDTVDVIEAFQNQLPVQYVFEERQGHSISRNAAIHKASGDYILWTDNDVQVSGNWLTAYSEAFKKHPNKAFFGSKIVPVFEQTMPHWIEATWNKCKPVFAERDLGDQPLELGKGIYPYGANFAVRADVQNKFCFNADLGRCAKGMLGGDEIDVLRKIDQAGHSGIWLPNAPVRHIIPPDRATTQYIANYFVGQGRTNILQGKIQKTKTAAQAEYLKHQLAWKWKRKKSDPDEWVSHLIRASLSRGEYQALKQTGGVRHAS